MDPNLRREAIAQAYKIAGTRLADRHNGVFAAAAVVHHGFRWVTVMGLDFSTFLRTVMLSLMNLNILESLGGTKRRGLAFNGYTTKLMYVLTLVRFYQLRNV